MRVYEIQISGLPHTVQLSDEDAKARGLYVEPKPAKAAPAPKNKARTAVATKG